MKHLIPVLIGCLALAGIADSTYLAMAHYQVISPAAVKSSAMCQLTAGSCETIALSKESTIFGIPHAILGAAYFAMVLGAVGIRLTTGRWAVPWAMLGLLIVGLGFSVYLVHAMFFVLHLPCPYCLTAHALNAAVVGLYLFSIRA